MSETFCALVYKITVEMIGDDEESIIVAEVGLD